MQSGIGNSKAYTKSLSEKSGLQYSFPFSPRLIQTLVSSRRRTDASAMGHARMMGLRKSIERGVAGLLASERLAGLKL